MLFFIFFYLSEYTDIVFLGKAVDFKILNENARNISFTLLEVTTLAIMYAFYKYGIKSNSIYKMQTNLSVGIGGDSGAGKSKLLSNLKSVFQEKLLEIDYQFFQKMNKF